MTRAEASRINGAKSKGPVTPEGKATSSQNNYRHGVYARRTVVLRSESREEYEENKDAHMRLFRPRNTFEAEAVTDIANARWKIRRIEKDATNLTDLRRSHDAPKHNEMLSNLTPAAAETLAYDSNCGDRANTVLMLIRAENSCQLAISRSLRNIEKSRKLIDPANNPPPEEILEATRLPIPAPENDEKSRFEPENPAPVGEIKEKQSAGRPVNLILVLLLAALLMKPLSNFLHTSSYPRLHSDRPTLHAQILSSTEAHREGGGKRTALHGYVPK